MNLTGDKHDYEDPKQLQSTQSANKKNSLLAVLTSRQWEELLADDSLMKSSRGFGWLVWEGAGGGGRATPSALCLICSF